ncbi:MAG TPA: MBL fold metallo-hydrolase [Candidatus Acidoferrales bacterium]|nr:MBL fold metallo-hydrolase [Candidatus Acidoferrales bacterium]
MKLNRQMNSAMTRRGFLRGASLAGAALAVRPWRTPSVWADSLPSGAQSRAEGLAQAPALLDREFASARKIGEGVYAVISDTTKGSQTLCNGGFLAGKDAALLWEGYASPAGAAFQLEALKLATKVPVKAAIDSHYHFDHSFGNMQYAAAGIPIWAHSKVASLMTERYAALQNHSKAAFFAPAENHLRDAISDTDKEHAQGDLNTLKFLAGLIDGAIVTLPNRSLAPSELPMKVDLGGLEVVIETYPGHTPGDLILRVPAQDIVFTADLLFHRSYPVTFDADVLGWLKTLDAFGRYGRKTVFVPGHGPICGQEGIELLKSVFADLAQHARQMAQMGVPLAEAQARYSVPEQYKSLGLFAWGFCIDQAVKQFYEAARGGKI